MTEKIEAFFKTAMEQPDMAGRVDEAYSEAATLFATRLAEISKGTEHAFEAVEFLAPAGALSDDQLAQVSGGGGVPRFPVKFPWPQPQPQRGVTSIDYHHTGKGPAPNGPMDIFKDINNFKPR